MSGPTYPTTIVPFAFAYSGDKTVPIEDGPDTAGPANWNLGWPPITSESYASGGVAPTREDFNGLFYTITNALMWLNGGGSFKFSSSYATKNLGYAAGARIAANDFSHFFLCTVAGTNSDPNSSYGGGWQAEGGNATLCGNYAATDTGADGTAYVIAIVPALVIVYNGMRVVFKAAHTSTSTTPTLDAGPGTIALVRSDGAALALGDIKSGQIYEAIYDSATNKWVLVEPVSSQINAIPATGETIVDSATSHVYTLTMVSGVLTVAY